VRRIAWRSPLGSGLDPLGTLRTNHSAAFASQIPQLFLCFKAFVLEYVDVCQPASPGDQTLEYLLPVPSPSSAAARNLIPAACQQNQEWFYRHALATAGLASSLLDPRTNLTTRVTNVEIESTFRFHGHPRMHFHCYPRIPKLLSSMGSVHKMPPLNTSSCICALGDSFITHPCSILPLKVLKVPCEYSH
jgi:hypothetical protein